MHHTKTIGDFAELKVALKFIERGYFVSKPLTDHAPYDLVVEIEGKLKKVQVKARTARNGVVTLQKYTSNREYSSGDFDLLALYCIDIDSIALIDWKDIKTKDFALRLEPAKNNQTKNVSYFKDYLFN